MAETNKKSTKNVYRKGQKKKNRMKKVKVEDQAISRYDKEVQLRGNYYRLQNRVTQAVALEHTTWDYGTLALKMSSACGRSLDCIIRPTLFKCHLGTTASCQPGTCQKCKFLGPSHAEV